VDRSLFRSALGLAFVALVLTLAIAVLLTLRASGGRTPRGSIVIPSLPAGDWTVIVGAGDIADCGDDGDEQTAAVVERIPAMVFLAGDNAYPNGSARDYRECYRPSWGQFLDRTVPVPGDNDYHTRRAGGYLDYFGERATPAGQTWHSWEAGDWHVVMLDSDCGIVGGCEPASAQLTWLELDLAEARAPCTLAIWHHPRFSSGVHGDHLAVAPFWEILYGAGAELVISGHDHDYERFAPQDPSGNADPDRGIREFVVGTGGAPLRGFRTIRPNSEVRNADTHGVIRLALSAEGYRWDFVPVAGETFTDSGSGDCH
jgi:hypothetical protein